jgi:hypothetical protein
MTNFDLAFIGAGVAGAFALQRLHEKKNNQSVVVFDIGRPPLKRKHQILGWLGCMPASDGKLFIESEELDLLLGKTTHNKYRNRIISYLQSQNILGKLIQSNLPKTFQNRLDKNKYSHKLFSYYQLIPKNIHVLSKNISDQIIDDKNTLFKFDEDVFEITYINNEYHIRTSYDTYTAKKIVLGTGRAGWKWTYDFLKKMDLITQNNHIKCGIKIESPDTICGNVNNPVFSLFKKNIEVGPFLWNGKMVPEDQFQFVLPNFRSNEDRWHSDKVYFNIYKNINTKTDPTATHKNATEELDRLANLTALLATSTTSANIQNERVVKETLKSLMAGKSKIAILDIYGATKKGGWLIDAVDDLEKVLPGFIESSKVYIPALAPYGTFKTDLDKNFKVTDSIYMIGEATGISGILQAAVMGNAFADKNF